MTNFWYCKFFFFLDGDVPRATIYGVYISQLIRFVRASIQVTVFKIEIKNQLLNFLRKDTVIIN